MNLDAFNADQRAAVEAKIAQDERYAKVKWTGRGSRNSLEWQLDGDTYSPSGLVWSMLDGLGFDPGGVRGPLYWNLPDGRSINDEAEALLAAEGQPSVVDSDETVEGSNGGPPDTAASPAVFSGPGGPGAEPSAQPKPA